MGLLDSGQYRFVTDSGDGSFHLILGDEHTLQLQKNILRVNGKEHDGKAFRRQLRLCRSERPDTHLSPESIYLNFIGDEPDLGLRWEVRVKLADDLRLIRWKVTLQNYSQFPLTLDTIDLLCPAENGGENVIFTEMKEVDPRFYANGWQSWSHTTAYSENERMRSSNLGFLQEPMVLNPGTPKFRKKGRFSSDMFTTLADKHTG